MCVPLLFASLEDRAADVRKVAADCVLPFMLHLGYEHMHKQLDKLKVTTNYSNRDNIYLPSEAIR